MTSDVEVTLAYATSGSGKSTFVKERANSIIRKRLQMSLSQFEKKFGFPAIIDGDELIAETIGWPKGKWWDELPKEEYMSFVEAVTRTIGTAARRSFVVFGVFPFNVGQWHTLGELLLPGNITVLGINYDDLRRNMESRAATLDEDSVKPTDYDRSYETLMEASEQWSKANPGADIQYDINDLPKLFEAYLDMFKYGVSNIVFHESSQDASSVYTVDGSVKGNMVRVRFDMIGNELMTIIFGSNYTRPMADDDDQILPYMSNLWTGLATRFRRVLHKHANRL